MGDSLRDEPRKVCLSVPDLLSINPTGKRKPCLEAILLKEAKTEAGKEG